MFGTLLINVRQTKSLRQWLQKKHLWNIYTKHAKALYFTPKAFLRVLQATAYAKEISFTFSLTVRDLEITSKELIFFFSFYFSKIFTNLYFKIISNCKDGTGVSELCLGKRTCQGPLQALHHSPSFNPDCKYKAMLNGNIPENCKREHFHSACSTLSYRR